MNGEKQNMKLENMIKMMKAYSTERERKQSKPYI